jgi:YafQ family addiction module toxin component
LLLALSKLLLRGSIRQPASQSAGIDCALLGAVLKQLKEAMLLLIAKDAPLPPEWLDHPLVGEWADHRECHVGGDFLLIYQLESRGSHELVIFVRAGTHAELFEWRTRLGIKGRLSSGSR